MAFHQTPFDHIGVWSPPMRLIPFLQGTCLVLIEASRFAASSLLIVLGLPLFAFLFLAGWDMGLLFAQLANLADHYREADAIRRIAFRSEEHTSELQSLMRISYAVFCLKKTIYTHTISAT